jgi:hypothetical protein
MSIAEVTGNFPRRLDYNEWDGRCPNSKFADLCKGCNRRSERKELGRHGGRIAAANVRCCLRITHGNEMHLPGTPLIFNTAARANETLRGAVSCRS